MRLVADDREAPVEALAPQRLGGPESGERAADDGDRTERAVAVSQGVSPRC
jgi:hypothetical protein